MKDFNNYVCSLAIIERALKNDENYFVIIEEHPFPKIGVIFSRLENQ